MYTLKCIIIKNLLIGIVWGKFKKQKRIDLLDLDIGKYDVIFTDFFA